MSVISHILKIIKNSSLFFDLQSNKGKENRISL